MTDDEIRAEAVLILTSTCTVQKFTETKGSSGGNIIPTSPTSTITGIPCMFSPKSSNEGLTAGAAQAIVDGIIYLPGVHNGVELDVQGKDKIVVSASAAQASRTYSVIGAPRNFQGIIIEAPVAFAE